MGSIESTKIAYALRQQSYGALLKKTVKCPQLIIESSCFLRFSFDTPFRSRVPMLLHLQKILRIAAERAGEAVKRDRLSVVDVLSALLVHLDGAQPDARTAGKFSLESPIASRRDLRLVGRAAAARPRRSESTSMNFDSSASCSGWCIPTSSL